MLTQCRGTLPEGDKILGLELFRFVAAFSVLIWHYQHFSFMAGVPVDFVTADQPFFRLLKPFYIYGYNGVQCFWCISGFIFFWKYSADIASRGLTARRFFVLRFSRLYPLHLVTLLLVAALQMAYQRLTGGYFVFQGNDWPHFLLQLGLASNWGAAFDFSFNGPIWSISLEVLVYALFFATLRGLGASPAWALLFATGSFAAMQLGVKHLVLECILFFYLGGLVAIGAAHPLAIRYQRSILWMAVAAMIGAAIWLWAHGQLNSHDKIRDALTLWAPLGVYIAAVHLRIPAAWRGVATMLGNMTYASYLIHFPLQLLFVLILRSSGLTVPYGATLFFLGYLAVVLSLSIPVYLWFEKPVQDRIRRRLLPPSLVALDRAGVRGDKRGST